MAAEMTPVSIFQDLRNGLAEIIAFLESGIDTAADNEKNPNYDLFILPLNSILIAICIVKRQMLQVTQVHMNEIFDRASFRRVRVN